MTKLGGGFARLPSFLKGKPMFIARKTTEVVRLTDRYGRPTEVVVERKRRDATIHRLQQVYHFRLA